LDVESTYWYPKKCSMKWLDHIPKFDGDPYSTIIAHIVEFTEFVLGLCIEHENVVVSLFLLTRGESNELD
jgi:hypothetical protein